jgi:hypothetical protein
MEELEMSQGIVGELSGIDLGDERLNKRGRKVLDMLAAHPDVSINAAINGWADTQAAYRFFSNPRVTPEQIIEPHRQATLERMREQGVVLVVQDTTELDYTDHPPRDALCLNADNRHGLYQHVQLAITPRQLPLGVVATHAFDREPATIGQEKSRAKRPLEDKESFRWLEGYRNACDLAAQCPGTQVISVADCEADIYDIFLEAQQRSGPKADYILRAHEPRSTPELNRAESRRTYHKVLDELERSPLRATHHIELSETPKRKARQAQLEVRAIRTAVKPPNHRPDLAVITHNVIQLREVNGPADGTDVCWLLVTTLPLETLAEILQVADYYTARWTIETYFRVLKVGCQVEKIMLETKSRLLNCLAMYHVIAWRILYLTHLNRTCPELPCTSVFADHEWKPVWRVVQKSALPKKPPRLSEFMKLITHLGGYNNRARELPAGPLPVWIGLQRMLDFSLAWIAFGEPQTSCV